MTETCPAEYLQAVRRELDAPKEDRERLLARLEKAVSVYAEENPEATAEDIASVFGTPEKCAAELLAECDPAELSKARRRKRRRLVAVIAVLAVLLVAMAAFWYFEASHQVAYVDIYITEDDPNTGGSNP